MHIPRYPQSGQIRQQTNFSCIHEVNLACCLFYSGSQMTLPCWHSLMTRSSSIAKFLPHGLVPVFWSSVPGCAVLESRYLAVSVYTKKHCTMFCAVIDSQHELPLPLNTMPGRVANKVALAASHDQIRDVLLEYFQPSRMCIAGQLSSDHSAGTLAEAY